MIKYNSVVLKFGGSVIANEGDIYRTAGIVRDLSKQYDIKAVVVSAMGKTTNNLDALAHRVSAEPNMRELDALLATGEMQSAALMSMCLNSLGVPAQSYNAQQFGIITDDNFGKAEIHHVTMNHVSPLNGIPIVAGFQGVNKFDDYTTLGREGSDITAVWVAAVMPADFCWFFKDGGGIYDKNPNKNSDAKLFKEISYTKMLNLIRQNRGQGQVLHKRSVQYAQRFNKPLFVSGPDFNQIMKTDMNEPNVGTWIRARVREKFH